MGNHFLVSKIGAHIKGWKEANAVGRPVSEIFHIINEESRTEVEDPLKCALRDGTIVGLPKHTILISRNGNEYPISDSGAPIRNEHGVIIGSVLVFRDQTLEHAAEKALQKSEYQLRKAERIANIGHWELHLASNKMFSSEGARLIYGLHKTPLDYSEIKKAPLPEYRQMLDEALQALIVENKPYDIVFKIKRPSDCNIIDIHAVAEYDAANDIVFGIIQDISELKLAEDKLMQANNQLKKLNATKDRLFSIIAHDLKNPLGSILIFSDLLMEKLREDNIEKSESFIEFIKLATKNSLHLLENLLYWARMQTNQMVFDRKKLDLHTIVSEVAEVLNSSSKIKNISIINSVRDDIVVHADPDMLQTILRNFIANAVKFTNHGGVVEVSTAMAQSGIEIIVQDNGIGMNENIRNKLFQPDTNFTSTGTDNEKGSGLGLMLCKEFVEKHGGKIWVESELGKGSTFHFTIP